MPSTRVCSTTLDGVKHVANCAASWKTTCEKYNRGDQGHSFWGESFSVIPGFS